MKGLSSSSSSKGHSDAIIIGGGAMGSSIAYFLKSKAPDMNVTVIEKDSKYTQASTTLSVSSIRQQFSVKENILLSMWSYDFMSNFHKYLQVQDEDAPSLHFQHGSYFFMAPDSGRDILLENFQLQRSVGADVRLLDNNELKRKFSWLNTTDLHSGCIGESNEGWFDPWSLLQGFRKKAISLGVEYVELEANRIVLQQDGQVAGVELQDAANASERHFMACDNLINAAGPWAGDLAQTIGVDLPVRPKKRYVFVFHCPEGPKDMVLAVDTSGCWFRREGAGDLYLCGKCPDKENDPDASDLHVDYAYFEEEIWPNLAHRIPAFEKLKVRHSWAGFYDYNTFDQNAIIGAHPDIKNLYFANGFSGHGIQQSPAVGNAISELILDGRYSAIDLSRFSFERIHNNVLLKEKNIV